MTDQSKWFNKIKKSLWSKQGAAHPPCLNNLSSQDAANEAITHFAFICQRLSDLDLTQLPAYLPMQTTTTILQEYQLYMKIKESKTKRAITPIDLPMPLFKEFAPELSKPLTSIINASLQQGKASSHWKTTYVTPVPKKPSPAILDETRPVSITCLPSLLCESFVADWAYTDLYPNLEPQYGNITATSTSHYLISLLNYIYHNLERRKTSLVITLIDFSKAFHLVDHTTAISKAATHGIRVWIVITFANFLTSRCQTIRM